MMDYEIARIPIIHNAPFQDSQGGCCGDDTDLVTNLHNGYLQSVTQRWVLDNDRGFAGESGAMVKCMHYPAFKSPSEPTLREANSRMLYLANNLPKNDCGNFGFGSVTYVINPLYSDKFFIAPMDTGTSCCHASVCHYGTLTDYYHLLIAGSYNVNDMFRRWYSEPKAKWAGRAYWELEWSGSAWLPESLLYIIARYTDMWGKTSGRQMQSWMRGNKRPLVWADSDDSGMLLDPMVNWLGYDAGSPYITDTDKQYFESNWAKPPGFAVLYKGASLDIRFSLRNWFQKDLCNGDESDPGKMVMGINDGGKCVFWAWQVSVNPLTSQQWLGPNGNTSNTMLFKKACKGTTCPKCSDLGGGDDTNGQMIQVYRFLLCFLF
jgi:hypothetical protein